MDYKCILKQCTYIIQANVCHLPANILSGTYALNIQVDNKLLVSKTIRVIYIKF